MNKKELQKLLNNNDVPEDLYSLEGGLPNEAYCIDEINDNWEVYYSERGVKSQLKKYKFEDEACKDLNNRISKIINVVK